MTFKSGPEVVPPKPRITLLGSYPPNYGGISVHIWRHHQWLKTSADVDVLDMYNGKSAPDQPGVHRLAGNALHALFKARRLLDSLKPDLLHIHVSAFRRFLLTAPILLTSFGAPKRVITIHGGKFSQNLAAFKPWQNALFKWMLSRFSHIICVSEEQKKLLLNLRVPDEKLSVINAYLPPLAHENQSLFTGIKTRKANGKLILLIAAQYLPHYGLLELLQAVSQLPHSSREKLCIAHLSYLDVDAEYAATCAAAAEGIDYINHDNLEPPDVAAWLAHGDVFVRPTWWDGDAVSVREACFFGNRIVATDVAIRPAGSELCVARDPAALAEALIRVIDDPNAGVATFDHQASREALDAVYRQLLA